MCAEEALQAAGKDAAVAIAHAEQDEADGEQQEVGEPHRESGGELAQPRRVLALGEQHVIGDDHADRDREAGGPPAVPVGEAERERDQPHDQAGGGDGEHLVHPDAGQAALLGSGRDVAGEPLQLPELELARTPPGGHARLLRREEAIAQDDAEGLVAAGFVALRRVEVEAVLDRVGELEHDALAFVFDQELAAAGDDDLLALAGNGIGEEDAFPLLVAGRSLEDVEDLSLPFVVEDPRLDLLGDGARQDVEVEPGDGAVALRQQVDHQQAVEDGQERRQREDRAQQAVDAHPGRPHGDELAVRGQTSDPDQNPQEQRHRDGQDDDVGQRIEHQLPDDRRRKAPPDDHLGRGEQELEQQNERVD